MKASGTGVLVGDLDLETRYLPTGAEEDYLDKEKRDENLAKELAMVFHVSMEREEDGWVCIECPALPGCVSQGKDEAEALENIREAIQAWLMAEDLKAALLSQRQSGQTLVAVTI